MSGQLKTACVQGMNHTDLYNEWIRKRLTCPRLQLAYSTNPRTGKSVTAIPNTQIHRQTKKHHKFYWDEEQDFSSCLICDGSPKCCWAHFSFMLFTTPAAALEAGSAGRPAPYQRLHYCSLLGAALTVQPFTSTASNN